MNPHQDLERMISSDVRSAMDFSRNTKQGGNYKYRERSNRLINKSAFVFKDMSRDCLRQWGRTNRIIERNNELKRRKKKERKKRKEKKRKERKNEREWNRRETRGVI